METLLAIGIGGFIGANTRYLVSILVAQMVGTRVPWGTLLINVSGSFLLAVFIAWAGRQSSLQPFVRPLVAVGFFGAYTTFSTYANETVTLFQMGEMSTGLVYILGTNLLCLLGVVPGLWLGSRI